jgi:glycine C-acetyltransferase
LKQSRGGKNDMLDEKTAREIDQFLKTQKDEGTFKNERVIESPQKASIQVGGKQVLNFCSNNYLGLSDDERVIQAAKDAMDRWGFGLSSVRFICGTQRIHKELEDALSSFLHKEDTILFSSCFDANGALFQPLVGQDDAIISDELNHASIIDGTRLSKAERLRYRHADMDDLKRCLEQAKEKRRRIICTDGVFSMDGDVARLDKICDLADTYDSMVMVDDSHATGYLGDTGRGSGEYWHVEDRIDLLTTTFGKGLGGASGGCISGKKRLIDLYRQSARPYLFSNSLAPAICGATLQVLKMLSDENPYAKRTKENAAYFRKKMQVRTRPGAVSLQGAPGGVHRHRPGTVLHRAVCDRIPKRRSFGTPETRTGQACRTRRHTVSLLISSRTPSTANVMVFSVSNNLGLDIPSFSRSWLPMTKKQAPARAPRWAAQHINAAPSISLASTPSRFHASHFCSKS